MTEGDATYPARGGVLRPGDGGGGDDLPPLEDGVGLDMKAMAVGARLLGPVLPAVAGRLAYRLWFRTVRPPDPPSSLPVLRAAERSTVDVEGTPVATYAWGGEGPVVLLVHGWGSHAGHLAGFVAPLRARGFRVVAFDAPAHGRSPGDRTDIFQLRDALLAVAADHGPLRGVVAHSLGSLAYLCARASGLEAGASVLVSPGVHLDSLLGAFTKRAGLSGPVADRLRRRVEAFLGDGFYDGVWAGNAPRTLVVHDREDREIPWSEGRRVARKLDAARLETTEGLGHRRILGEDAVQHATARFIPAGSAADAR